MLTKEQLEEADKISQKNEVVKVLLDFYTEAQADGFIAAKIAINKKWLDLASDIEASNITIKGDDKVYESFLKTTKLFEDIGKSQYKQEMENSAFKTKRGHEGKVIL